jgi:hypothetical protein
MITILLGILRGWLLRVHHRVGHLLLLLLRCESWQAVRLTV